MERVGDVGEASEHPMPTITARSGNSFVVVDIGVSSVGVDGNVRPPRKASNTSRDVAWRAYDAVHATTHH